MRATKSALVAALVVGAATACATADSRPNPYGPIVDRNAFGLKPPPPPVVETPQEPAKPPPNVKLTGISNLFRPRALLEITEQQAPARPGQAPPPGGIVNRPILAEGETSSGVEVVAIDLERSIVKIRNGFVESELTFEAPKPTGAAPAAPAPTVNRVPAVPSASAAAAQPTVIESNGAQASGGGGVTLYGGTTAGNNSGVTTYGGNVPSPLGAESGLRTIPSRTIRTPSGSEQQVDPAQQALLMELNRNAQQQNQRPGYNRLPSPPIPPTQLTPPGQPNGGQPTFQGQNGPGQ